MPHDETTAGQRLARDRFEYNITRLRTALHGRASREALDMLVRLCEGLLDHAGSGPIVTHYRAELRREKAAVELRDEVHA
jgi:hypothetical protein